ncbi:hypothetical protein NDU88_001911 [Pleurodeles waltl]|uniref:Uncharacterized protein n=1 Tax=Pleurodeles waltl TaxID=8319 RepID=A0AAV7SC74_PLEWA|nr:hypothetical protein NDU88_001911 [Pleurodeles waltl]
MVSVLTKARREPRRSTSAVRMLAVCQPPRTKAIAVLVGRRIRQHTPRSRPPALRRTKGGVGPCGSAVAAASWATPPTEEETGRIPPKRGVAARPR